MTYQCELCGERIGDNLAIIMMHTVKCFILGFIELMRLKDDLRNEYGKR